jgi:hypothetical protein
VLDLYDRPIWRDWLFYVTLVGIWAGVIVPESRASPIDLVFAVGFQFALFGVVPGLVRRWVRRRRH